MCIRDRYKVLCSLWGVVSCKRAASSLVPRVSLSPSSSASVFSCVRLSARYLDLAAWAVCLSDVLHRGSGNHRDMRVFHHHQSLNREGRWGTTDDIATSFLHCSLFSTALWDLPNSRPVHSLMLSSHLFVCPPCLLPPFTVPCKMVLARPDERET